MAKRKLSEARHRELRQYNEDTRQVWNTVIERRQALQRAVTALREAEDEYTKAGAHEASMLAMAIAELEG